MHAVDKRREFAFLQSNAAVAVNRRKTRRHMTLGLFSQQCFYYQFDVDVDMSLDALFSRVWYAIENPTPGSFTADAGDLARFARLADPQLSRLVTEKKAKEFIIAQYPYVVHRKTPSKKKSALYSRPYLVFRAFKSLSMDTMYVIRPQCDNIKFINFTNYVSTYGARKVNADAAVAALDAHLDGSFVKGRRYSDLATDRGPEFRNLVFANHCRQRGIDLYHLKGKANKAENAIR
jgi:hypothetical protein